MISIGGSVLLPEDNDISNIKKLSDMIKTVSETYKLYLVIGGGRIARQYIDWGRKLGADEATLDELGIATSRLNARLLIASIGRDIYPIPAKQFNEAITAGNHYSIVTMGGTHPGHTTDAVAAMLAERLGAKRLINATSIDGVYTEDPRKNKGAERLDNIVYNKLLQIVNKIKSGAGPNIVFDPLAAKIIKRASIKTYIVDGNDLNEFKNAIMDKKFHGTTVG